MSRVILATHTGGKPLFYTGKAGDGWLSENITEAFGYNTWIVARAKAQRFNAFTPVHNKYFVPVLHQTAEG